MSQYPSNSRKIRRMRERERERKCGLGEERIVTFIDEKWIMCDVFYNSLYAHIHKKWLQIFLFIF